MKNRSPILSVMIGSMFALLSACGASNNGGGSSPAPVALQDSAPDQPYRTHKGAGPWEHWNHPDFNRPVYNWHSDKVTGVSCDARDSHGNSYVVVERDYKGLEFQAKMAQVEDSAVDRCYANSHRDSGCKFQDCTPEY